MFPANSNKTRAGGENFRAGIVRPELPNTVWEQACSFYKSNTPERTKMKETLLRLWSDDDGQDLVEYALLVALISVALIGAMGLLKGGISTAFSEAISAL
jgi:pilus assembly protein Flp/PilA